MHRRSLQYYLVVVNLNANGSESGFIQLPNEKLKITDKINVKLHDLITDEHFTWTQEWNYIQISPDKMPFNLFKISIEESNMWCQQKLKAIHCGSKTQFIYEVSVRGILRQRWRWYRWFPGADFQNWITLEDLGVNTIWLLPFFHLHERRWLRCNGILWYPSELRKTLRLQRVFERCSSTRYPGWFQIALNHTSDQHPWFQRSRKAKSGSRLPGFLCVEHTSDKYKEAPGLFADEEQSNWAWDEAAKAYFLAQVLQASART